MAGAMANNCASATAEGGGAGGGNAGSCQRSASSINLNLSKKTSNVFHNNKIYFLDFFASIFSSLHVPYSCFLDFFLSFLALLADVVVVVAVAVVGHAAAVVNLKDGVAGNMSAPTTFPAF